MRTVFEPVLNNLYLIAQCGVLFFDPKGELVYKRIPRQSENALLSCPKLLEKTLNYLKHSGRTLMLSKTSRLGGCSFPDHSMVVVGPVSQGSEQHFHSINAMLNTLAWFAQRYLPGEVALSGVQFGASYMDELAEVSEILPDWSEVVMEDAPHHSYADELLPLDAVVQGDVQAYINSRKHLEAVGKNGTLGYSPLRHHQNLALCHIVLCSRAAIFGGISVEQAYTMADFLILAVERCRNLQQADLINDKTGVIFARMVHDVQMSHPQAPRPLRTLTYRALELVKRYVYQKTDRKSLAAQLKVQADYLDRVLKSEINLTLMGCLKDARLKEAANLLRQSEAPIHEIASMLFFANASHFCRVFKSHYGQTPNDYRQQSLQNLRALHELKVSP